MTVRRLDNVAWGFESSCFVCEPTNDRGLRIPFFHDDEAEKVTAEFSLGPAFSGSPRYVHGGVTLAVLDEAMAWAAIACARAFCVTAASTAIFLRPVQVGLPHRVEARLVSPAAADELEAAGVVLDGDGRCCVESSARLRRLSDAQAASAIGEVTGDDAAYLRG